MRNMRPNTMRRCSLLSFDRRNRASKLSGKTTASSFALALYWIDGGRLVWANSLSLVYNMMLQWGTEPDFKLRCKISSCVKMCCFKSSKPMYFCELCVAQTYIFKLGNQWFHPCYWFWVGHVHTPHLGKLRGCGGCVTLHKCVWMQNTFKTRSKTTAHFQSKVSQLRKQSPRAKARAPLRTRWDYIFLVTRRMCVHSSASPANLQVVKHTHHLPCDCWKDAFERPLVPIWKLQVLHQNNVSSELRSLKEQANDWPRALDSTDSWNRWRKVSSRKTGLDY